MPRSAKPTTQDRVLAYIEHSFRHQGRMPTMEQIRQHMDWRTTSSVCDAVLSLVIAGKLIRRDGRKTNQRWDYELPG